MAVKGLRVVFEALVTEPSAVDQKKGDDIRRNPQKQSVYMPWGLKP